MSRGLMTLLAILSISISLRDLASVLAQPAPLPFQDCFSGNDSFKLNVSTVYGQILSIGQTERYLNLTVFGESAQSITGFSNESTSLGIFYHLSNLQYLIFNSSYSLHHDIRPHLEHLYGQLVLLRFSTPTIPIACNRELFNNILSPPSRPLWLLLVRSVGKQSRADNSKYPLASSRSLQQRTSLRRCPHHSFATRSSPISIRERRYSLLVNRHACDCLLACGWYRKSRLRLEQKLFEACGRFWRQSRKCRLYSC